MDDHLGDLFLDMRYVSQPVGFRDQLCEPNQLVAFLGHCREPTQALPQAERMGKDSGLTYFAVEKDPLSRDKHVVQDHKSLGHVGGRRDWEDPGILMTRGEGGVDYF